MSLLDDENAWIGLSDESKDLLREYVTAQKDAPAKESKPVSLLDEYDEPVEDFTGRVRRTKNGRPYVLANPDWQTDPSISHRTLDQFTEKSAEPRGPSALYTRVTTYISCLEDTYSLGLWAERMVTLGLAQRPQLVAAAQRVDLSNVDRARDELNEIASKAKDAANWKEKADLGTDFHEIAREYDEGRESFPMLSRESYDMLKAYREETADWEYAHIENGMVSDTYRTYGTPDRLRWVRGRVNVTSLNAVHPEYVDGKRILRVTDIKTGRIDYGWQKMELQLALYALSDLYDPDTGIRTELDIDQEYAEIVHVPYGRGECTVYVVPIGEAIEVLRTLVPRVRAWRSRKPSWVPAGTEPLTSGLAAAWPATPPEAL